MKTKRSRNTFNENYFSKPNIQNSYWAGFIAADGCILNRKNRQKELVIALAQKDLKHLKVFKENIKFSGSISTNNVTIKDYDKIYKRCTIRMSSNKMCEDLKKNFNITPRKTFTLKFPKNLTKKQKEAYIIGYIDGDGSIHYSYRYKKPTLRFNVIGKKNFLLEIQKIFIENFKLNKTKITKDKNIYRFYAQNTGALLFLKPLSKFKVPKLNRKWDKIGDY